MKESHFHPGAHCAACSESDCPLSEGSCPELNDHERKLKGWVFSGTCVLVFLMPVLFAIAGSLIMRHNPTYGLLGGIAGFALGTLISTVVTRVTKLEN